MKKYISMALTVIIVITGIILGFVLGNQVLSELQFKTLKVLAIMCACSAAYCFIVGELAHNNSQMDKLWSIIPIAYMWVIAAMSNMNVRLVVFAVLVTIWGIRLTTNFALKGAYSIKFWSGEEDYRWIVLRNDPKLKGKVRWALFDLLFISLYQNALVLAICLPGVAIMESNSTFGVLDYIVTVLVLGFIILEIIADIEQMKFHTTKKKLLKEGKTLEELPAPYNKGFNTIGLWNRSRHPNYFSEQAIWLCLYLFVISSSTASYGIFNWSMAGSLLLVLLFMGSSAFSEGVSSKKYPEYNTYLAKTSKYLPLWRYEKR